MNGYCMASEAAEPDDARHEPYEDHDCVLPDDHDSGHECECGYLW